MSGERRLRRIIRERAARGEGVNEIFGWIKRKWQKLTDSDLERVQRAAAQRGSGVPFVHEDDWYHLPKRDREELLQMAEEWHDLPQRDKSRAETRAIRSALLRGGRSGSGGSRSSSGGGRSSRGGSGYGGGGYGGYYGPYDSYYGYGYGGYYGGGSSGKSHRSDDKDKDKDDSKEDRDDNDDEGSGSN